MPALQIDPYDNPDRTALPITMSMGCIFRTEGSVADFNFNRVGFTVAPVVAHRPRTLVVAMGSSRRSAFAARRSNLGGVRGALTRSIRLER